MKHLEGVEEGRYYVEQVKKEVDLSDVGNQLDPALEQDNADCDDEVMEEHPDFGHIDPDLISTETNVVTKSIYKQINIPSDQELRKATRKLDKYQKQVVSVGINGHSDCTGLFCCYNLCD